MLGLFAKACSQDQPTFSADVNVVSILATVRDKSGRIIKDRDMDDFVLFEDGAPQKIRYFSRETDLPLTVGLLRVAASAHEAVLNNQTLTERVKALAPGIGNIVEVEDAQMYITGRRERELAAAVEEIGRHASGVRVFVP